MKEQISQDLAELELLSRVYNILTGNHVIESINCRIEEQLFPMDDLGHKLKASGPQTSSNNNQIEEELLVEQAEQGNEEAFQILQERYEREICRYISRIMGSYESALDLTQDTFIKAWRALPMRNHNQAMNFRAWLYRIGYTTAVDHLRKYPPEKTSIPIGDRSEEISKGSAWAQRTENDLCQRESINAALQQVYPQYRRCILMRFVGGYSFQEIAQALGISEVSVRTYISRGRQQFIQAYLREIGEEATREERR